MDILSSDLQKAIQVYREKLAELMHRESLLQEENDRLRAALLEEDPDVIEGVIWTSEANPWYRECLAMQNSFSWKITRPLRLVKKVLKSLKVNGIRTTIHKVKQHLRS